MIDFRIVTELILSVNPRVFFFIKTTQVGSRAPTSYQTRNHNNIINDVKYTDK